MKYKNNNQTIRQEVLEYRFRIQGVYMSDLNKRLRSIGIEEGLTGLARKYDCVIDIALNSLESTLRGHDKSNPVYRRKRIIANVSRHIKKMMYSPILFNQVMNPVYHNSS